MFSNYLEAHTVGPFFIKIDTNQGDGHHMQLYKALLLTQGPKRLIDHVWRTDGWKYYYEINLRKYISLECCLLVNYYRRF